MKNNNYEGKDPSEIICDDLVDGAKKIIATGVEWHHMMQALSTASSRIMREYSPSHEVQLGILEIKIKAQIDSYNLTKDFIENYDERANEEFFRLLEKEGFLDTNKKPH